MTAKYVIEHCQFYYQCPMQWAHLNETEDEQVRFCDTCKKEVHLCTDQKQYDEALDKGWCVAVPAADAPTDNIFYTVGVLGPETDYSPK